MSSSYQAASSSDSSRWESTNSVNDTTSNSNARQTTTRGGQSPATAASASTSNSVSTAPFRSYSRSEQPQANEAAVGDDHLNDSLEEHDETKIERKESSSYYSPADTSQATNWSSTFDDAHDTSSIHTFTPATADLKQSAENPYAERSLDDILAEIGINLQGTLEGNNTPSLHVLNNRLLDSSSTANTDLVLHGYAQQSRSSGSASLFSASSTTPQIDTSFGLGPNFSQSSSTTTLTPHFASISREILSSSKRPPHPSGLASAGENKNEKEGTLLSNTFQFFGDDQTIPAELQVLQSAQMRRKQEFESSIHNLQCKLAALTAICANECMDLEKDMKTVMKETVHEPVAAAAERLRYLQTVSKYHQDTEALNWVYLEKRISKLDAKMTEAVHGKLQSLKLDQLHSLHEQLLHDLSTLCRTEQTKADGSLTGLHRKLEEDVAGNTTRRFQEERASRVAAVEVAAAQLQNMSVDFDSNQAADQFLATVRNLRQQLREERVRRQEVDKAIVERIVQTTSALKRAMLEL